MNLKNAFILTFGIALCSSMAMAKSKPKLIGGSQSIQGLFPSTLLLYATQAGCTAARIGVNHILTAAHCLLDSKTAQIPEPYTAGKRLLVTNNPAPKPENSGWQALTIKNIHIHPSYLFHARVRNNLNINVADVAIRSFDIAVIEVQERMNDGLIPIANLDFSPVQALDVVDIMGYGCEDKVGGLKPKEFLYGRLKSSASTIFGAEIIEELAPARPYIEAPHNYSTISEYNFFSAAPRFDARAAGLCPGDSGGPVYRTGTNGIAIVGVNSYYSFRQGEDVPYFNWHTRLSKVRNWLLDILYPSGE